MTDPSSQPSNGSRFKSNLIRVLIVQAVALAFLWFLQARYHLLP